jgi:hypothetical protein
MTPCGVGDNVDGECNLFGGATLLVPDNVAIYVEHNAAARVLAQSLPDREMS